MQKCPCIPQFGARFPGALYLRRPYLSALILNALRRCTLSSALSLHSPDNTLRLNSSKFRIPLFWRLTTLTARFLCQPVLSNEEFNTITNPKFGQCVQQISAKNLLLARRHSGRWLDCSAKFTRNTTTSGKNPPNTIILFRRPSPAEQGH